MKRNYKQNYSYHLFGKDKEKSSNTKREAWMPEKEKD